MKTRGSIHTELALKLDLSNDFQLPPLPPPQFIKRSRRNQVTMCSVLLPLSMGQPQKQMQME